MMISRTWRRARAGAAVTLLAGAMVTGTATPPASGLTPPAPAKARAILKDNTGADRGGVLFTQVTGAIRVQVAATGLTPGWHGFHVHATGDCAVGNPASPFTAAGGHLGAGAPLNQTHGSHDGDMPLLYAGADGVARATFRTDNFTMAQLLDTDGSAVIVHAGADNYGHIPADASRYRKAPFGPTDVGPDSVASGTTATGDAGLRQRCGVVQSGGLSFGSGYWMVARDGGVFNFGDAPHLGSAAATPLNQPMVAMAATPSRAGYWLVASDGGVFSYGDAKFQGSTGNIRLNSPIVGVAAAKGYVTTQLRDVLGQAQGFAQFSQDGNKVRVDVHATGLTDGWHGFHVHAVGNCTSNDGNTPFSAAGGHLGSGAPLSQSHSNHDGDMPLLYSTGGVARASFRTDNFTLAQLLDADGSAVIVHAQPDNYANIPADGARYRKAPFGPTDVGPDDATLSTGDAGARQRCGQVARTGEGYFLVAADGGVFAYGDAVFRGSTGGTKLNRPVVAMAATPSNKGYWLVASDGGVFAFGDAVYHGGTGGQRIASPIVGMAPTSTGLGYWLVAADGGVFAFGDAQFHGSTGDFRLNSPIVGMAATPTDGGYWLMAADGGVFTFGDADFVGSAGNIRLNQPIRGGAAHTS